MPREVFIGLMSGTSADGIDAALVEFASAHSLQVHATQFTPFDAQLQTRINALAHGNTAHHQQPEAKQLSTELAHAYAKACKQIIAAAKLSTDSIIAIANHGQTVAHRPNAETPESIQLGDSQLLAQLTGCPVISHFRQADIAHGGQGAPLMPAFHKALIEALPTTAASNSYVLNLGGIANITAIQDFETRQTIGFDTGPANTLLNQWVYKHQGTNYDDSGKWAASGDVNQHLLDALMSEAFFNQGFPKSTGPDLFNLEWLAQRSPVALSEIDPADVQATLLALTVESIALALEQMKASKGKLFVCGGGVRNDYLMTKLGLRLADFQIQSSDAIGVPPDWVEAVGFAWLGYCHHHKLTSNLPSVTGARKEVVLGERFI